ncbi:unnamed protein product [Triticum turgidum subsp. durum]|uniref:Uncharacterized protein n=1 Tax=Triticum turgidum subsp. durum TaxID=4567 RepID=A0A9R0T1E3_TRITD|nr:unnamed protein product [Triticum turgidum subsp. durum]
MSFLFLFHEFLFIFSFKTYIRDPILLIRQKFRIELSLYQQFVQLAGLPPNQKASTLRPLSFRPPLLPLLEAGLTISTNLPLIFETPVASVVGLGGGWSAPPRVIPLLTPRRGSSHAGHRGRAGWVGGDGSGKLSARQN